MSLIRVEFDDRKVLEALAELQRRADNPRGAYALIGENLVESTKRRFDAEAGPDGQRWPANTQATFDAYLSQITGARDKSGKPAGVKKGAFLKDGRISKGTANKLAAKKVLQGHTGLLRDTIHYALLANGVEVGTDRIYGAMMQFGGTKAKWPHLWGDVPARPYLGLSDTDEAMVLDVIADFLADGTART